MKKVVIHFGLHKTGSSSIQNFLGRNRQWLSMHNIHYPLFSGPDGKKQVNHSVPLKFMFSKNARFILTKKQAHWKVDNPEHFYHPQFEQCKQQEDTLLLSAESISHMNSQSLQKLKSYFDGWEIEMVAYVRPAYSYYCSAVQELVKSGVPMLDRKTFISRSKDLEKINSLFPNVQYFSFKEACAHHQGVVGHFCHYLGISVPEKYTNRRDNIGLGNVSVRVANEVNRRYPLRKNGKFNADSLIFNAQSLAIADQPFRLRSEELRQFEPMIHAENQRLSDFTGLDFNNEALPTVESESLALREQILLLGKVRRLPKKLQPAIMSYLIQEMFLDQRLSHPRLIGHVADLFWLGNYASNLAKMTFRKLMQ